MATVALIKARDVEPTSIGRSGRVSSNGPELFIVYWVTLEC